MLRINGSIGEGGGQVLRTSLALSAVTGTPFRIEGIRAKRTRPGLLRQHLTAVRAMAEVCSARVMGAELGSKALSFEPGPTKHGAYEFAVGTAGSATLVFQTVLPALLSTAGESRIVFEGGTHNAWAPPVDFMRDTFIPLLHRMGASVSIELSLYGFYPAGGGRFVARIAGGSPLVGLELSERGEIESVQIDALVSQIPVHVAEREVRTIAGQLADLPTDIKTRSVNSPGPGNVAIVRVRSANVTETFTAFGERGVKAETIAHRLAGEVRKHVASEVPVGEHLADQLLIPLALAGAGEFVTSEPSLHTTTNLEVIGMFLPGRLKLNREANGVRISSSGGQSWGDDSVLNHLP